MFGRKEAGPGYGPPPVPLVKEFGKKVKEGQPRKKRDPPLASLLPGSLSQARNAQLQSTYSARICSPPGSRSARASKRHSQQHAYHTTTGGFQQTEDIGYGLPSIDPLPKSQQGARHVTQDPFLKSLSAKSQSARRTKEPHLDPLLPFPSARTNVSAIPFSSAELSCQPMQGSAASSTGTQTQHASKMLQDVGKKLWPHFWKRVTEQPAENSQRKRASVSEQKNLSESERCVAHFREYLMQKYKSAAYAWHALDDDGNMNIGEIEFRRACQRVGYRGSISTIWKALDSDGSGSITLLEINPKAAAALAAFKCWGEEKWGSSAQVFHAIDAFEKQQKQLQKMQRASQRGSIGPKEEANNRSSLVPTQGTNATTSSSTDMEAVPNDGNGQLTFQEIKEACKHNGFSRMDSLKILYQMMDADKTGYVTIDEMAFLDKWKPPLFLMVDPDPKVTNEFKRQICENFDGSRLRAWCCALDVDRSMKVTWDEYEKACGKFAACVTDKQAAAAWRDMDDDLSGWISLAEWDPDSYTAVLLFKRWAKENYGSVQQAFRAIDVNGTGSLTLRELMQHQQECEANLPLLFKGLDFDDSGTWDFKELKFVDQWQMNAQDLRNLEKKLEERGAKRGAARGMLKGAITKVKVANMLGMKIESSMQHIPRNAETFLQSRRVFQEFYDWCIAEYGSMLTAWCNIDPSGSLELRADEFDAGLRPLAWKGDVSLLWRYLDRSHNDTVGLLEFAPKPAVELAALKLWAQDKLGLGDDTAVAFKELGSPATIEDFFEVIREKGFMGSLETFQTIGQHAGVETVAKYLQLLNKWQAPVILICEPDAEELGVFKDQLLERFDDELLRAWCSLDVDHAMYISWKEFTAGYMKVWQQAGVFKSRLSAARAWRVLDPELVGWISLKQFDEESYNAVKNFKRWAIKTYGDVATIFSEVDKDGNGRLAFEEIASVASRHVPNLDTVFHGLDAAGRGVWYEKDFEFLDVWVMDDVGVDPNAVARPTVSLPNPFMPKSNPFLPGRPSQ